MQELGSSGTTQRPAWTPGEFDRKRSRLLAAARKWGFDDLGELHRVSVDDPEWFWRAVVEDLNIEFSKPFDRVLDASEGKPFPRWFTEGRINIATLCAHRHAAGEWSGKEAVVYEGDSGQRRALNFAQLEAEVRRFAGNLARLGVQAGDRVALFLPPIPEAVVAFLGCARLGAVSVLTFSGYGADALATRLRDSEAVALVTVDGTTRRGKRVPMKATADEALESAPAVRDVVVVRHLADGVDMTAGRDVYWDELDPAVPDVPARAMDPNDALAIIYTSGTTGRPKGIVHSHGGFAVKAGSDLGYGFDVQPDDVVAWITDMGWLVGPLLITGALQLGATIVLGEGVPDHPTPNRLWELARRNDVTLLGIAPTAARNIMARGDGPPAALETLRGFASTGEAWDEATWWWLFEQVGRSRLPIVNFSGGTEVGGGILNAYPFLPAEPMAFNGPLPGMDVGVLDQHGRSVVGEVGELAVRNTWPGMTHAFWQERDRYLDTYWNCWDGVWVHGDLASVDPDGNWCVHGRSDDTMKISGRRVGPAEVEAALLRDRRITEAAVIGVPDEQRGQRVVAFVVASDQTDDVDLIDTATHNVDRAFAPTVRVVDSLPKTKNGKIMRKAIRARYLGADPGDLSALDPATPIHDIPPEARDEGEAM